MIQASPRQPCSIADDTNTGYKFTPAFLFTDHRIPSDASDPLLRNRVRRLVCALACIGLQGKIHQLINDEGIPKAVKIFDMMMNLQWGRHCADKIVAQPRDLSEGEYYHIIGANVTIGRVGSRVGWGNTSSPWDDLWALKERLLGGEDQYSR